MKLKLLRNAAMRLEYAGRQIITDPYLAAKFTRPSYTGKSPNPLVDLPCSPEEAIAGAEAAIISHLHSDHFDTAGQQLLPKDTLIFCQPEDAAKLREKGFQRLTLVVEETSWEGISIRRTPGQHGSGGVLGEMGTVSGFVLRASGEPTVYWVGDSIWYAAVAEVIQQENPDVIITHSSGAVWGDQVLIVMDAAQTVSVCRAAPDSKVIAVHMEALDHGTTSRVELREVANAAGIRPDQLLIPADGEEMSFSSFRQNT